MIDPMHSLSGWTRSLHPTGRSFTSACATADRARPNALMSSWRGSVTCASVRECRPT
jgi:hypothetical protein